MLPDLVTESPRDALNQLILLARMMMGKVRIGDVEALRYDWTSKPYGRVHLANKFLSPIEEISFHRSFIVHILSNIHRCARVSTLSGILNIDILLIRSSLLPSNIPC